MKMNEEGEAIEEKTEQEKEKIEMKMKKGNEILVQKSFLAARRRLTGERRHVVEVKG